MPPGVKTLAAVAAAAAMVGAAIVGRNALDTKTERDDLRLTVVCDPLAEAFCRAAAAADDRLTIKVESPEVTTKRLTELNPDERPDFQAWVSVGPWLQMADGRRGGQAPLSPGVMAVASSPLVLVTRLGQKIECGKPVSACLPLPRNRVGLPSPRTNGVGLAGLAQIVLARTGITAAEFDRSTIESGEGAATIDALVRANDPRELGQQVAATFSFANPVVTVRAATTSVASRVAIIPGDPPLRAVLQVGLLDAAARMPLSGGEPAGQAMAKAAIDAGWDQPGDPSGGLPDPGVLAALQDAWPGS